MSKRTVLVIAPVLLGAVLRPFPSPAGTIVAGPPVLRSEVILEADRYARVHWRVAEDNRLGSDPDFLSDYPIGFRIGMGYKWGAWDTVEEFLAAIDDGKGTGTGGGVSYHDYDFDSVTGISCTGLVSRAWQLNQHYMLTSPGARGLRRQVHRIAHEVPGVDLAAGVTSGLKKGDALQWVGRHIMLFVYETRDGFPMVIDATAEGVRFRKATWDRLRPYQALRYDAVVDDPEPEGTLANPIVIQLGKGVFTHEGNTRNVVSMDIDRYAPASEINQQGPEAVYVLHWDRPGRTHISINDLSHEGIDNDLHLLSSLEVGPGREAVDCLARGEVAIETSLDAGTYYVVVDSGHDLPGEYTLNVLRDPDALTVHEEAGDEPG